MQKSMLFTKSNLFGSVDQSNIENEFGDFILCDAADHIKKEIIEMLKY